MLFVSLCYSCISLAAHPSCLKFTPALAAIIMTYQWECIECKSCAICNKSDQEVGQSGVCVCVCARLCVCVCLCLHSFVHPSVSVYIVTCVVTYSYLCVHFRTSIYAICTLLTEYNVVCRSKYFSAMIVTEDITCFA